MRIVEVTGPSKKVFLVGEKVPEGRTKVLVVEDDALIRLGFRFALEEAGYLVLDAGNADEAIVILGEHPEVRVVVTDVRMPGSMNGFKLAHFVRGKWPSMALIVISGEPGDGYITIPPGAIFCAKPLPDALLVSSVGVALAAMLGRAKGKQAEQNHIAW